jgi:hypothetical protein
MPNHALRHAIEDFLQPHPRVCASAPPAADAHKAAQALHPACPQQPPMRPPPPAPQEQALKRSITGVASKLKPAAASAAGSAAAQAGRLAAVAASKAAQRQTPASSAGTAGIILGNVQRGMTMAAERLEAYAHRDDAQGGAAALPPPALRAPSGASPQAARQPPKTAPSAGAAGIILGGVQRGMIMAAEALEAYANSAAIVSGANPQGGAAAPQPPAQRAPSGAPPQAARQAISLERMDTDEQIAAAIQMSLQDLGAVSGDGQQGRVCVCGVALGPVNNFCTQCGAPAR